MTDGNKRGFASMDDEKQRESAQKGGQSSYQPGADSEEPGSEK